MHMQSRPVVNRYGTMVNVANSMTLYDGEHFGHLGNTGASTGAHLHIDVHRLNTRDFSRGWENTIDPRAFFRYGFSARWPYLNIQP